MKEIKLERMGEDEKPVKHFRFTGYFSVQHQSLDSQLLNSDKCVIKLPRGHCYKRRNKGLCGCSLNCIQLSIKWSARTCKDRDRSTGGSWANKEVEEKGDPFWAEEIHTETRENTFLGAGKWQRTSNRWHAGWGWRLPRITRTSEDRPESKVNRRNALGCSVTRTCLHHRLP